MFPLLFEPAPVEGGGEGGKPVDLVKAVEAVLAKHGNDNAAALRALLAEGSVVLTADEAKALSAYRALGNPDDLVKAVKERDTYKGEVETTARQKLHGHAAELTQFKPAVLTKLADQDKVEIVIEDSAAKGKDGKPVKVASVKLADGKTKPLADFSAETWGEFLPSLKAEPAKPPYGGSPSPAAGTREPKPAIKPDAVRRSLVR
jgi:hypothetical protein